MKIVRVFISLKEGVLDPQGKAVLHSLTSLGYQEVRDVRLGKYIELQLEDQGSQHIEGRVREMCERLLANTVIESYRFEVSDS